MVVQFHSDLPIHTVYKKVVDKLEKIVENRQVYIDEYNRCRKIAECSHNPEDRQAAHSKYLKMEKIIKDVEDGTLVDNFKEKSIPIVKEYLDNQGNGYVFGSDNKVNIPKRVSIIITFMNLINDFIHMEWECTFNMEDVCPRCFSFTEKRSNVMVCPKCKFIYASDPTKPQSSDPEDHVKESTYKSVKNYKREFFHLCGLQNSCEPGEVDGIASYLYRSGIKKPTRADIRLAIPGCGYKNYNDTNYIYSEITKESLPPISEYMPACTDRFEKYYMEFDKRHPEDNVTNLHFLTKLFLFQEKVHTEDDWFRKLSSKTEARHRKNAIGILAILRERYPNDNWVYPPEWDQ